MKCIAFLTCVMLPWVTLCDATLAQDAKDTFNITALDTGVDASFRGIAIRNENEAWVTGSKGTVIRTRDAGRSWKPITVPNADGLDFRDVEVLPDGSVLLMSVGPGDSSRILRATDGGEIWQTMLVNAEPKGFFDGMAFHENGRIGVLFGDPIDGFMDIYATNDGGQTWKRSPVEQRPKLENGEYGFAASGSSIQIIGPNIWIATGGSIARLHHSPDGGKTWQAFPTPVRSGNESSGIFSIDAISPSTLLVIGGDYLNPEADQHNFAKSTDGGKTWTTPESVRMPHKACIQSLGGDRLMACGRTGIAYSNDVGQTWATISNNSYYNFAFDRDSATGFLAGSDGRVSRFELKNETENHSR